jgi:regulator of protease activity HflC (stomatin/prohibitin superfamily)
MNIEELAIFHPPSRRRSWAVRRAFVVREFEAGLLYRHGRFVERLGAGRHVRWGRGFEVETTDLRLQTIVVSGQEVMTSDNAGLKVSIAVAVQVIDPAKSVHEVRDWREHLHAAVQLALRAVVAAESVETLVAKRLDLASSLAVRVTPEMERIGVAVRQIDVRDIMFPGELKKVFAEVLRARQEGLAALERARGEGAALRNLANAARLLENNPELQSLRWMQAFAAAGAAGGKVVMNAPEWSGRGRTPAKSEQGGQ